MNVKEILKDIPVINAEYEFIEKDSMFLREDSYQARKPRKRVVGKDTFDVYLTPTKYTEYGKNGKQLRQFHFGTQIAGDEFSINPLVWIVCPIF